MELYSLNEMFYTMQMMNPMSAGQIALWHALVRIANKARWPDWFTVAGITLVQLSGLSSAGVKKARNELKQRGLIDFKSNGTKAASYRLLNASESSQDSSQNSNQDSTQSSNQDSSQNSSPLKDNTKQNTSTVAAVAVEEPVGYRSYIEQNLRSMTPGNWEEARSYIEDGLTVEMICHAVDEANAQGKKHWAYVRGILNRYLTEGITTIEQTKSCVSKQAKDEPKTKKQKYTYVMGGKEYTYEREVTA